MNSSNSLTEEQQEIVESVINQKKTITVNAIAGSGKTKTSHEIVKAIKPKDGLYTAFNRAIVQDSKSRFGDLIDCSTIHAFAYRYFKPKEIRDLSPRDIKENISNREKYNLIKQIDSFFRSKYVSFERFYEKHKVNKELFEKYINLMVDKKIPCTFNFLLKNLHCDLVDKRRTLEKELLILDECQDTTEVTLAIFLLINSPHKVLLGDRYQNIYSFMETVNAFNLVKNTEQHSLTKSFRCSEPIAEQVEEYGRKYLNSDFIYRGNDQVKEGNREVYLTRTNPSLIGVMKKLIEEGLDFSCSRSVDEIFELPISIYLTLFDKEVKGRYSFLKDSKVDGVHFFDSLEEEYSDDKDIQTALKICRSNSFDTILRIKKMCKERKNPNRILSTAHAFKGMEGDIVYINEDLDRFLELATKKANEEGVDPTEEYNTYYVALSRAKTKLLKY